MTGYVIRQLSIFSENRPGRLSEVAEALAEEGINIFAFSIAEAEGFGVIRAIVNRPEDAHRKLSSVGFMVAFTDVIAMEMKDNPGGLAEAVRILRSAGINIEYAYAYSGREKAVLILRVGSPERAAQDIMRRGGRLVGSDHFS